MDSGDKDFPKGRQPAPPRPFAGLRHCYTSSQGWVSRAFGWCRTRVTQCSSPTAVAVWLGRRAAWRSSAQSVPRTQPERRESGSGANSHSGIRRSASAVDCRASFFSSAKWEDDLRGILQGKPGSHSNPGAGSGVKLSLSRRHSPHLDQEPIQQMLGASTYCLIFWTPDFRTFFFSLFFFFNRK